MAILVEAWNLQVSSRSGVWPGHGEHGALLGRHGSELSLLRREKIELDKQRSLKEREEERRWMESVLAREARQVQQERDLQERQRLELKRWLEALQNSSRAEELVRPLHSPLARISTRTTRSGRTWCTIKRCRQLPRRFGRSCETNGAYGRKQILQAPASS